MISRPALAAPAAPSGRAPSILRAKASLPEAALNVRAPKFSIRRPETELNRKKFLSIRAQLPIALLQVPAPKIGQPTRTPTGRRIDRSVFIVARSPGLTWSVPPPRIGKPRKPAPAPASPRAPLGIQVLRAVTPPNLFQAKPPFSRRPLARIMATVQGVVKEPTGAVTPYEKVRFKLLKFAQARPVIFPVDQLDIETDSAGSFSIDLAPGRYSVTIKTTTFYVAVPADGGTHELSGLVDRGLTAFSTIQERFAVAKIQTVRGPFNHRLFATTKPIRLRPAKSA
jgi:hypothetical protein